MSNLIDRMSDANLDAMFEYLSEEIAAAKNKKDLDAILSLTRELFLPPPMQNAVRGLNNIRAEMGQRTAAKKTKPRIQCTVELEIPYILRATFNDLSARMRALQDADPETFSNATSALTWLANGKIHSN